MNILRRSIKTLCSDIEQRFTQLNANMAEVEVTDTIKACNSILDF